MIRILTDHYERQAERNKKRNDEDYDDGVEEQLVDEDEEVGSDDTSLWPYLKPKLSVYAWLISANFSN